MTTEQDGTEWGAQASMTPLAYADAGLLAATEHKLREMVEDRGVPPGEVRFEYDTRWFIDDEGRLDLRHDVYAWGVAP